VIGTNNGEQNVYSDTREIQHKLDITLLKLEKAELEAKYWREKYEFGT
jgi:hypothetical protein